MTKYPITVDSTDAEKLVAAYDRLEEVTLRRDDLLLELDGLEGGYELRIQAYEDDIKIAEEYIQSLGGELP